MSTTFIKAEDKILDSLIQLETTLQDDTSKVDVINHIASIYLESNYPEALNYATKSYNLSEQISYETGRITALMHKSYANDFMGRYAIAQQQNYELLSIFENLKLIISLIFIPLQ